jgi:hypothetical protein
VSAGPGGVDEQRREALHPAEHGDVIDLDPTLGKEFLDITKGQPEPEIPANREDDHLGREPEPDKRCNRDRGYRTNIKSAHPTTVALGHDNRLTQQSPPIEEENVHLTCYDIKGPQKTKATESGVLNQFESDMFTITSWNLLCVPSEKLGFVPA